MVTNSGIDVDAVSLMVADRQPTMLNNDCLATAYSANNDVTRGGCTVNVTKPRTKLSCNVPMKMTWVISM